MMQSTDLREQIEVHQPSVTFHALRNTRDKEVPRVLTNMGASRSL